MWRLAILSMGLLLAACDQELVGTDRFGDGDYEVVALIAD